LVYREHRRKNKHQIKFSKIDGEICFQKPARRKILSEIMGTDLKKDGNKFFNMQNDISSTEANSNGAFKYMSSVVSQKKLKDFQNEQLISKHASDSKSQLHIGTRVNINTHNIMSARVKPMTEMQNYDRQNNYQSLDTNNADIEPIAIGSLKNMKGNKHLVSSARQMSSRRNSFKKAQTRSSDRHLERQNKISDSVILVNIQNERQFSKSKF
jgi:hypothetical protein